MCQCKANSFLFKCCFQSRGLYVLASAVKIAIYQRFCTFCLALAIVTYKTRTNMDLESALVSTEDYMLTDYC